MEKRNNEQIAMALIAGSGDARTTAFMALAHARKGDFVHARSLLKKASEAAVSAHQAQTDLLIAEANGDKTELDILMVHAQDHLMTSLLAQELITEMISLYENKEDRKER